MRPVIAVSLNGRAYQLEDDAHATLAQYLSAAELALAGNPDQAEILADLEQAIADKCDRFLSSHKTVLTRGEIEQVIEEMGPVDGGSEREADRGGPNPADAATSNPGAGAAPRTERAAPKRLYQISEGALLSGVCMGIAVYFDVDVTLIRLLFVVAAILTGGLAVLVYVAMMFIVPYANTPEEIAAASGLPFNARILVEQWKRKAAQFADAAAHAARMDGSPAERARRRSAWRRARWQWRREWRTQYGPRHAYRFGTYCWPPRDAEEPIPGPMPPLAAFAARLSRAVIGILIGLITLAWLYALLSLLTSGEVFGWSPTHLPIWAAVVLLLVLYKLLAGSLRTLRYAHAPYFYPGYYRANAVAEALVGLALFAGLIWLLSTHMPAVEHFFAVLQELATHLWHHGIQHSHAAKTAAH